MVSVKCKGGGDGSSNGRITLSSIDGSNYTKIINSEGEGIKIKLIASRANGSNTLGFVARDGYSANHQMIAMILPFDISTYGTYKGVSLVKVDLL